MNRPILAVTVSYILGIATGSLVQVDLRAIIVLAVVLLLTSIGMLFMARRQNRWVFLMLFFILGWLAVGTVAQTRVEGPERFAGHYVALRGTVVREPQQNLNGVSYHMMVEAVRVRGNWQAVSGRVLVYAKDNGPVYSYGDRLEVGGFLYLPPEPTSRGMFDYRAYLERRGIYCILSIGSSGGIKQLAAGDGNLILRLAYLAKQNLVNVAGSTLDERQTAVLSGMLFGSRGKIEDRTKEIFNTVGLSHVLCVSGLHVGFVLAGSLGLLGVLGVPRRWMPLAVLPLLLFYAVMTGMGPAVIRAVVMAMVVLVGLQLGRDRDWPTALALAALVILAINPLTIYEIGFQLSFAATWGILYLAPLLGNWLQQRFNLPRWLALPLQVTLAAQLGTLPLVIYYFNLMALAAPLANLALVPMVGLIMLLGFAGCALGMVWPLPAQVINAGTGAMIDVFLGLAELISILPGGAVYLATPPWYVIPVWYLGLVITVELVKGNIKIAKNITLNRLLPALTAMILVVLLLFPWHSTGGRMEVHFIDVGQGDCILVRFPGGQNMLVDAGGKLGDPDQGRVVGDRVVVPYLRRLGINNLDALVVTHAHEDHAGGVPAVVDKVKVAALVLSATDKYDDLLAAIPNHPPIYRVGSGRALNLDPQVEVLVLHPQLRQTNQIDLDSNNSSVVLRLEYGNTEILLTGDIEVQAQAEILGRQSNLQADIFKVPHHGSRFLAPQFYTEVAPQYAVIQVGANNRFGHPAPEALTALEGAGAHILRNDLDGSVVLVTDGKSITVQTAK